MTSATWFLREIASIFSNLPIALYALGFHVQDGVVSAICNKAAAPMPFIGSVMDLKTIWNVRQNDLFGILGPGKQFQVASLRHGNTFPLVNKAVLSAAGCIDKTAPVSVDLTQPRAINLNITFCTPKRPENGAKATAKLIGGLMGLFELCAYICSAVFQARSGIYIGSALAACLAVSTFCYLMLQQLVTPVYAHRDSIQNDIQGTAKNGAATDIHVIVPDWNSEDMYVVLGYTSYLHALTNVPARANRPYLLLWICRMLGIVLCIQAALLAKLIQAPPPALYGAPIWLLSTLAACLFRLGLSKLISRVDLPATDAIELFHVPRIVLPARRSALAFIASLPITPAKVERWSWVDGFIPDNVRRRHWQQEMELANFQSPVEPKINLSDDGRRIVTQVRSARYQKVLADLIKRYESQTGIAGIGQSASERQDGRAASKKHY